MTPQPIKIRWINPIGISDYDQAMATLIGEIKSPATEVELVSLAMKHSPRDLEYRTYEGLVTADTVRVTRDAAVNDFDGIVIGCFYDVALAESREISGRAVVVAPCQASVMLVTQLANKFSVIVGRRKWIDQMESTILNYGYQRELVSLRSIDMCVDEFQQYPEKTKQRMFEQAELAIKHDHAEAIVLGCTIEFGFFQDLQTALGVPVIDPVLAAFKTVEYLAGMKKQFQWQPSRVWGCEAPPEADLLAWKIFAEPAPIGNRIWIPKTE
jgi:allantoin racemase